MPEFKFSDFCFSDGSPDGGDVQAGLTDLVPNTSASLQTILVAQAHQVEGQFFLEEKTFKIEFLLYTEQELEG
jgi:hypothetical protein